MNHLTSRKLVAAIMGMVAICTLVLLVGLYPETREFAGKALVALGGVILTTIGAQTIIDNVNHREL